MGYGSGSLFRRGKKGIWYYQAWVDGLQIGPTSSKSTKREDAQRELDKLLGKRARGELIVTPKTLTIGFIAESYLRHAERTLTPNTAAEYRNHCNHQIVPAFGKLRPLQLTHSHLEQFRDRRSKEKATRFRKNGEAIVLPHTIKPATINRELAFLRAALNHWNETNPDQAFRVPVFPMQREDNTRKGFETEAGFKRIYEQLPYAGLRALAAASFYTGVRRVELTAADWDHVDFTHSVMTIYRTKNHEPREVPIFSGLMEESLREAKQERDDLYPECQAVFAYEGKRLLDPKRAWHNACKRAKAKEGLMIHDLRRSANRNMRDLGVPQPIRMTIMGHQTDSMDRRYGIVDRTDLDVVRELYAKKQTTAKITSKTTAQTTVGIQSKVVKSSVKY